MPGWRKRWKMVKKFITTGFSIKICSTAVIVRIISYQFFYLTIIIIEMINQVGILIGHKN